MTSILTILLAALSALSAITSLMGSAHSDKRNIRRHEWVTLCLTLLTFIAIGYQTWENKRLEQLHTALGIDWEREIDSPFRNVSIGLLFPDGITTESDVANTMDALHLEIQTSSSSTSLSVHRGADGRWLAQRDSAPPTPALKIHYGVPIKTTKQRYCWWSDSWPTVPTSTFRNGDKEWQDRALCNIEIEVPIEDLPISTLRSLGEVKRIRLVLDKDPGKNVCDGDCNPVVSLFVNTESNRFDVSPFQDMSPEPAGGSVEWASSGEGVRERLHLLFGDREGFSMRESILEKMGVVDRMTRSSRAILIRGNFYIFPSIPKGITEYPQFTGNFGQNMDLMVYDKWCGLAKKPNDCVSRMVVVDPNSSKP